MANGGNAAMKSVIAQLGQRQQLASSKLVASSGRPSPATKPQPADGKPTTGNGVPRARRVPTTAARSTAAADSDVQSAPSPAASRPPATARKPTATSPAVAGQTELLGAARLKPAVARKPPAAAAVVGRCADEPGEDEISAAPVPPWKQELVKRKNVSPTPGARKQATTSVVQPPVVTPASRPYSKFYERIAFLNKSVLSLVHQTWNWVTFCDPVTRESSDPETQLTR